MNAAAALLTVVAIAAVNDGAVARVAAPSPAQTATAPAIERRLSVVLLLDASASMTHEPLLFDSRYAQVFNAFQLALRPGDRAAVGVLAGETRLSAPTSNARELSDAVRWLLQAPDAARLSGSPIRDGLDRTLTLAADPARRSAIVLFSDGKSGGNIRGLDDVIARARQLRVSISVVVEGPGSAFLARNTGELDPAAALDCLAQQTGGRRLLDRPLNPRERNPGPLVALIMEFLRESHE